MYRVSSVELSKETKEFTVVVPLGLFPSSIAKFHSNSNINSKTSINSSTY